MQEEMVLLSENIPVTDAAEKLLSESKDFGIVLSQTGKPIGLIKLSDVTESLLTSSNGCEEKRVCDVMSFDFSVIDESQEDVSESFLIKELGKNGNPIILLDKSGKIKSVFSNHECIEVLKKQLKYAEAALDNIEDGVIIVDDNMRIKYMNSQYKNIHAITDETLIGKSVNENFPESKFIEININNDCLVVDEPLHLNYSGATVIPSYRAMTDDEEYLGATAIVKDYNKIQNLYIAFNKFNELNHLSRLIFENLKEAILIVSNKLEIIYSNKQFRESFSGGGALLKEPEIRNLLSKKFNTEKIDAFSEYVEIEKRSFLVLGIPLHRIEESSENIILIIQDNTKIQNLESEINKKKALLAYYKKQMNKIPEEMICESEPFKEVVSIALKAASTDANVIIEGENGVGKEIVANLLHQNSKRSDRPFIPVNCGAIPNALWESEMFGYEEGAFTGANKGGKTGILEMANGGTVFLDEVGEISLADQVKMLRFLQNMEIAKVGRKETKKVDVRIIVATNKSLSQMVQEGTFREDLYYRLNVVKLNIPPLRDRTEEIKPLALKFLKEFNDRYDKDLVFSADAISLLCEYAWPGNIRQLRNVVEQSVIMCDQIIQTYDLLIDNDESSIEKMDQHKHAKGYFDENEEYNLPLRVRMLEQELIIGAMKECDYNKTKAIEKLNIARKTFYKKIKEYELTM